MKRSKYLITENDSTENSLCMRACVCMNGEKAKRAVCAAASSNRDGQSRNKSKE